MVGEMSCFTYYVGELGPSEAVGAEVLFLLLLCFVYLPGYGAGVVSMRTDR